MLDTKFGSIALHFIVLIFVTSCNKQIKFDKDKWRENIDPAFPSPYRNKMLKDLTANYKLVGLKYSELINLLGEPNFNDSTSLGYDVIKDYGHDIDPVYTKNLDFIFSKNSVITSFKIIEWRK
jgi:hypothetical protein